MPLLSKKNVWHIGGKRDSQFSKVLLIVQGLLGTLVEGCA